MFPYAHSIALFSPASPAALPASSCDATLAPKRRYTRAAVQAIAHNFHKALKAMYAPVATVPVARLISMLDCDHDVGSKYAVVSKPVKAGRSVTTVLDVPLGKVWRAEHATGMVRFWKDVAKRRPAVEFVSGAEEYEP